MTERCTDLDEFFDGELPADQADAFREHLVSCERCQCVLEGRMQENIAARVAAPVKVTRVVPALVAPGRAAMPPSVAPPGAPPPGVTPIKLARRRGCGRILLYLAPALAVAAALPLYLIKRSDSPLALAVDVEHIGTARGDNPHVGDVLRSTVRGGERHRAIWVYLDYRDLVAACPDDERCSEVDGQLVLKLPLKVRGEYTIVGLSSPEVIAPPPPHKTLDEIQATPRTGVEETTRTVPVD